MRRRKFTAAVVMVPWLGAMASARAVSLTEADALTGVRTALEKGAASAVSLLGRTDGFLGNPKVRIPLPPVLEDAQQMLKVIGQQKRIDELVTSMNRAAEAAVPEAKTLLVNAVRNMSVEDARQLVTGGDTSVTDFFATKTRDALAVKFLPIVTRATEKVKLADKYNALAGKAAGFGLLKQEDANIQAHVTTKALDGLYLMIGEEERKIRDNPAAAGSAILKKVFGALK